jgi:hypothetical protein
VRGSDKLKRTPPSGNDIRFFLEFWLNQSGFVLFNLSIFLWKTGSISEQGTAEIDGLAGNGSAKRVNPAGQVIGDWSED